MPEADRTLAAPPPPRFRRRLLGYEPAQVDDYIAAAFVAYEAARGEIAASRQPEVIEHVSSQIGALVTSFAETVGAMHQRVERDVRGVRAEADAYAARLRTEADSYATRCRAEADSYSSARRAEADELVAESAATAVRAANAVRAQAAEELLMIETHRKNAEERLCDVGTHVEAALKALRSIDDAPPAVSVDLTAAQTTSSATPSEFSATLAPIGSEPVESLT